ncbi:arrestin domain-containing protein 1-like [Coccinella septempunctata]|uniref:arrestin domain-containing protein 1-like n=1 Tax=Coccinella septempunctata TaxID=41139 RepID=UPI001D080633|nr:arrestin domain-containing protein 1-like [Coccinella septempunctata]
MKVKVIIENEPPLYPGTVLRGKFTCSVDSSTQIRSVKIRCYGKEYTEWRGSGKNAPTYIGTHYFFQMETKLFEPEDGVLNPGFYSYPFTFLLPPSLPSTFEFPYGYVRYSLKGIVDIPLAFDPTDRVDLAVISILDISTLPESLRQPCQTRDESMMGCCLVFNSEPVTVEAQINKRVFIVGEIIKINMEVNNTSGDNLEGVEVKLVRSLAAHSEKPRHDIRYINEDLIIKTFSGVGAHGQQTYDVNLRIPSDLPVPNLVTCQLLESIYRVEVVGKTSGLNRDINFVLAEISIGHVDGPGWSGPSSSGISDPSPYPPAYPSQSSGYPYPPDERSKTSIGFASAQPSAPPSYKELNGEY